MHAIEKILARAAGKDRVRAGEIVTAAVDLAEINDLYLQVIQSFEAMGGKGVWDPDKVVFVFDHYSPPPTPKAADNHRVMREFVAKEGIPHLFDIDAGVCHQVMPEGGLVRPGMVLVATDSHTTTHGAFGAFATGVGATDLAVVLIRGTLWFVVPEVVKIELTGRLPQGTTAKDVVLGLLQRFKADGFVYKAVEYAGPAVTDFSIAERMVICNMAVEMGAKTTYIQPDDKLREYLAARGIEDYPIDTTDPDYEYAEVHQFDVGQVEPLLAAPHSVDNVHPVGDYAGTAIDQAFIGTCTGGRLEDLEMAAKVLRGRRIPPGVRLVITPASKEVFLKAMATGCIKDLVEAGATVTSPGCGPCLGIHQGMLGPGEVCITASSRNFPGRMGSPQAEIYVASPLTVAASALRGRITDPREVLEEGS
ncbi:MAG: 3-isopropylmalate dehydratase large subunit [Firmicutes bacterium]|jgi:3-isopropylmalate/(R)-2-methylmalate dehydratase large subunit|nr:3-isopropylmalate dehydratase large subunit [Bacillota bacterium]